MIQSGLMYMKIASGRGVLGLILVIPQIDTANATLINVPAITLPIMRCIVARPHKRTDPSLLPGPFDFEIRIKTFDYVVRVTSFRRYV